MAGQNTAELFIAGTAGGRLWMADPGTALPSALEAPAAGWTDMGYLSEDGYDLSPSVDTEDFKVWPLKQTALSVVTGQEIELKLALAQWNADTTALYFGGQWATAGGVATLSVPLQRSFEKALVIDAEDGGRTYRYVLARASLSDFETITHKHGELALLGFTLKVLPASDSEWFQLVTDDEAILGAGAVL